LSGAVVWFSAQDVFDEKRDTVSAHFGRLFQHSTTVKPFALFALNTLKNLFANANVEARFSTVTLCKSKHRSNLNSDKVKGYLIGRTLQSFSKVSFPDLWARLKPWMQRKGYLTKLRGKYFKDEPAEEHDDFSVEREVFGLNTVSLILRPHCWCGNLSALFLCSLPVDYDAPLNCYAPLHNSPLETS
jgi:hypothetical protein